METMQKSAISNTIYRGILSEDTGKLKMDIIREQECDESKIKIYENHLESFRKTFDEWKQEREDSLKKLQELKKSVHNDQMFYNKTKYVWKKANLYSRMTKSKEKYFAVNFLASLGAFFTDAADSVTSVAQAINIDNYQNSFKEIMEHDAEITKQFYKSRSACLKEYENIEEIIKCYHSDTFNSTISKISDVLKLDKLWISLEKKLKQDSSEIFNAANYIINKYFKPEVLQDISVHINDYTSNNPAVVEACKLTSRALYDVIDWKQENSEENKDPKDFTNLSGNQFLILVNKTEIAELQHVIHEEESQAKLESKIEDAIDSLQFEMEEISLLISQLKTLSCS